MFKRSELLDKINDIVAKHFPSMLQLVPEFESPDPAPKRTEGTIEGIKTTTPKINHETQYVN